MGSITYIVDDKKILNQYEYDAWGNVVSQKETIKNRFKFNGQQLDPITQQYYLRVRFYNPIIGRFTQEDTYRGDGLNLYAYCDNNPVYYVDPSGNVCKPIKDIYKENAFNRIQYLRNKYGTLTKEQLHNRINLRQALHNKLNDLKKNKISKRLLGPMIAGVYDPKLNKYYFGLNNVKGEIPKNLHPLLKERYNNMPKEIKDSYERTLGAGSHAEIYALNEALNARENLNIPITSLNEFYLNVISTQKLNNKTIKTEGVPVPRCPHCEYLTENVYFFPEVLKYGKKNIK